MQTFITGDLNSADLNMVFSWLSKLQVRDLEDSQVIKREYTLPDKPHEGVTDNADKDNTIASVVSDKISEVGKHKEIFYPQIIYSLTSRNVRRRSVVALLAIYNALIFNEIFQISELGADLKMKLVMPCHKE